MAELATMRSAKEAFFGKRNERFGFGNTRDERLGRSGGPEKSKPVLIKVLWRRSRFGFKRGKCEHESGFPVAGQKPGPRHSL